MAKKKAGGFSYLFILLMALGVVAYVFNIGGFRNIIDSTKNKEKDYTEEVSKDNNSGTSDNGNTNNTNNTGSDNDAPTSIKDINTKDLEIPSSNYEVVRHSYYSLGYDEKHEQAAWVAYKLEAKETRGSAERDDRFIPDPKVKTKSARHSDYSGSGYDRGHLAPAADFKFSDKAMAESFYMSNMSPQKPRFNRGIWKELEEKVRDNVRRDKAYYVVSGPVLKGERLRKIGRRTKVSVPRYYYKILLDLDEPEIKAIAFLMKNEGSEKPLSSFVVSIDKVEEMTGLDFFPNLPDALEKKLEASTSLKGWEFD